MRLRLFRMYSSPAAATLLIDDEVHADRYLTTW